MSDIRTTETTRATDATIEIKASPDRVWNAFTKAEELVRWFPLQAKVTPGPGGSMTWSWDEAWTGTMRIDLWEPGKRLRLVEDAYRPYDAKGQPLPDGQAEPTRIAVEVTLETHAGATRLRLVHSGFGHGVNWDDELDGVSNGWQFELRSLRHYLERHYGRDRHFAWAKTTTDLSHEAAWGKLLASDAFDPDVSSLGIGAPYAVTAATGDRFSGRVELNNRNRDFFGTVSELDDGILRLSTFRAGGVTGITVWLATYASSHKDKVKAAGVRLQTMLDGMFTG